MDWRRLVRPPLLPVAYSVETLVCRVEAFLERAWRSADSPLNGMQFASVRSVSERPLVDLASMVERLERLEGALRDCELSGYEREASRLRTAVDLLRWRVRRQSTAAETPTAS